MADPIITASRLSKIYGEGGLAVRAVDGIDLTVDAGEFVLIMGPSGSGKTTLLTMLGGLLQPSAGEVWVAGQPFHEMSERELPAARRHSIGFVFQSFNLLQALTVQENVLVALNFAGRSGEAANRQVAELLSRLGLEARSGFLPRQISGGERQRTSIARALAHDPPVILADEPTANLDAQNRQDVMRILRGEAEKARAVVVVGHDERLREYADRILWLEDGGFRDLARYVRDPNCGMEVPEDTPYSAEVDGELLKFCAAGCRDEYLTKSAHGTRTHLQGPA